MFRVRVRVRVRRVRVRVRFRVRRVRRVRIRVNPTLTLTLTLTLTPTPTLTLTLTLTLTTCLGMDAGTDICAHGAPTRGKKVGGVDSLAVFLGQERRKSSQESWVPKHESTVCLGWGG
jgi:hypothetical protein